MFTNTGRPEPRSSSSRASLKGSQEWASVTAVAACLRPRRGGDAPHGVRAWTPAAHRRRGTVAALISKPRTAPRPFQREHAVHPFRGRSEQRAQSLHQAQPVGKRSICWGAEWSTRSVGCGKKRASVPGGSASSPVRSASLRSLGDLEHGIPSPEVRGREAAHGRRQRPVHVPGRAMPRDPGEAPAPAPRTPGCSRPCRPARPRWPAPDRHARGEMFGHVDPGQQKGLALHAVVDDVGHRQVLGNRPDDLSGGHPSGSVQRMRVSRPESPGLRQ
jgi:hypothetical protein